MNHVRNIIESGFDKKTQIAYLNDLLQQYFACFDEHHFEDVSQSCRSVEGKLTNTKYAKSLDEIKDDIRSLSKILFYVKENFNNMVDQGEISVTRNVEV